MPSTREMYFTLRSKSGSTMKVARISRGFLALFGWLAFLGATHILPAFGFQLGLHFLCGSRCWNFMLNGCFLGYSMLLLLNFFGYSLFLNLFNLLFLRQFFCLVDWIGFTL